MEKKKTPTLREIFINLKTMTITNPIRVMNELVECPGIEIYIYIWFIFYLFSFIIDYYTILYKSIFLLLYIIYTILSTISFSLQLLIRSNHHYLRPLPSSSFPSYSSFFCFFSFFSLFLLLPLPPPLLLFSKRSSSSAKSSSVSSPCLTRILSSLLVLCRARTPSSFFSTFSSLSLMHGLSFHSSLRQEREAARMTVICFEMRPCHQSRA